MTGKHGISRASPTPRETQGTASLALLGEAQGNNKGCSKQAMLRAYTIQGYERTTLMTPYGFKTIRIHPSTNQNDIKMNKYRTRPKTAIGLISRLPRKGQEKHEQSQDEQSVRRAISAEELRSSSSQTVRLSSRPCSASSCSSSLNRSIIFSTRNPSCSPPEMYKEDSLRAIARKYRPRSRPHSCEIDYESEAYERLAPRRALSAVNVADRCGKPIHLPKALKENNFLTHEDLTMGQKQYVWGMARIYSMDNLKTLKQRKYQSILNYEYMKRIMTKGVEDKQRIKLWKEYGEYQKFVDRFAKGLPVSKYQDGSACAKLYKAHAHQHSIIGWTTDTSEGYPSFDTSETNEELQVNNDENETSFDQNETKDIDRPMTSIKARPKSSKYRERSPQSKTVPPQINLVLDEKPEEETNDNLLASELEDRLQLTDSEENYI